MRNDLTELVFILDMSGSMSPLRDDTIGGYNTLLDEQKKSDGDAVVTTILFDDRYIVLHDREPIRNVNLLTDKEYAPLGTTAMLDAVGKTINSVGQKLAAMEEKDRPGNVIVTIITDGMENASKEFSWNTVKNLITEQRDKYSWTFTFIGANIDNIKVSDDLGIDRKLSKKYTASKMGTQSVYSALSTAYSKQRQSFNAMEISAMSESEITACRTAMTDELSQDLDDIK